MSARNVVVTGAASGIGRAVATACALRGDQVFLVDVRGEASDALAAEICAAGSVACDVSDALAVESAAAAVFDALGRIDLVVHCAGVSVGGPAVESPVDDLQFVTNVNILGTFYVGRSFGGGLVTQQTQSRIVFVGSEHSLGVPHLF